MDYRRGTRTGCQGLRCPAAAVRVFISCELRLKDVAKKACRRFFSGGRTVIVHGFVLFPLSEDTVMVAGTARPAW
jgi:hypothetical protein